MTRADQLKPAPYLEHLLLACIAYFLYDTIAMFKVYEAERELAHQKDQTRPSLMINIISYFQDKPVMLAHHLVLALVLTPMMFRTLDHEPGDLMVACALIFEASTPFVSLRAILSHLNLKKSLVYILNGLVMVLVFFCCRILVYPWFYYSYGQLRNLGLVESVLETPRLCSFFMILTLAPQIYWFKLMAQGAVKVLKDRQKKL